MRGLRHLRPSVVCLFVVAGAASGARAQEESGERRATTTSVVVLSAEGIEQAAATRVAMGVRRAVGEDERLRFVDSVDVLSGDAIPEEVQQATDGLDALAERLRSSGDDDALESAERAVAALEANLGVVRRATLVDAHMLLAIASCRAGRRQRCQAAFAHVLTFREDVVYDIERYPADLAHAFDEARRALEAQPRGSIDIGSEPSGAEVFVDGQSYGPSPVVVPALVVGDHYVTLKLPGFEKVVRRVTVEREFEARVSFELPPSEQSLKLTRALAGLLAELGRPRAGENIARLSAILYVNQVVLAQVRREGVGAEVELFLYDLRTRFLLKRVVLTFEDGSIDEERVRSLATELYQGVDLSGAVAAPEMATTGTEAPMLWERWWFWGAVGIVAVSSVVAVIVLDTEPEVPEGFTRVGATLP